MERVLRDMLDVNLASEEFVREMFPEEGYADVALEIIGEKKKDIAEGNETDWSQYYGIWSEQEPSEKQIVTIRMLSERSEIFQFEESELVNMNRKDASVYIDWLILEDNVRNVVKHRKLLKEAGDRKLNVSSVKKLMRQYEKLARIWNDILEDDVITSEEAISLYNAVKRYRIYGDDFRECIDYIEGEVLNDGKVDVVEMNRLYEYVSEILSIMKRRIAEKMRMQ